MNKAPCLKTKKSKKQKIALVVLIFIVVFGVALAGWTLLIQPGFFPTIFWKTYKSEKNGFQVKYPTDYQFEIEVRTENDWKFFPFFSEAEKESFSLKKEMGNTTIRLSVYDNPKKLNPREWQNWAHENNDHMKGIMEEENNFDFF